jgi:DNA-binding NarL/FixJ family response regulator
LIVISTSRDHIKVISAIRAGANAYLLKDEPPRHFHHAINFVRDGGIYISPSLKGTFTQGEEADRRPV